MSAHIFKKSADIQQKGFRKMEFKDRQKVSGEIPARVGFAKIPAWEAIAMPKARKVEAKRDDSKTSGEASSVFD